MRHKYNYLKNYYIVALLLLLNRYLDNCSESSNKILIYII